MVTYAISKCILHSFQQDGLGLLLVFCFGDLRLLNFWKVPEPLAWQARSSLPYWALLNSGFNFHYGGQACHQAALLKLKCVHCSLLRVCLIFQNVSWGSPSWSTCLCPPLILIRTPKGGIPGVCTLVLHNYCSKGNGHSAPTRPNTTQSILLPYQARGQLKCRDVPRAHCRDLSVISLISNAMTFKYFLFSML